MKDWLAGYKQEMVLRLLRRESRDVPSPETSQLVAVLSGCRDEFLEGGVETLKRRTDDPKVWKRAKRLLGDLMRDE